MGGEGAAKIMGGGGGGEVKFYPYNKREGGTTSFEVVVMQDT